MAKYFLIAGEASGDNHAAALMRALRTKDSEAVFVGLGGDKMQAEGCTLYQHYEKMAYMGYVAVLTHLSDIRRNIRIAEETLLTEQPDHLILIDYPGFNLRMAQYARRHLPQTTITYYIPPKIWAWKRWRVHKIGKYCDHILGIFPFEPDFYAQYGYSCRYVGNPTAEQIHGYLETEPPALLKGEYIALLPGSRMHEIEQCLPKMLAGTEAAIRDAGGRYDVIVTMAPGIERSLYEQLCKGYRVSLTADTYAAVRHARAAVVNSGTATLETALLGCPQVAVYHLAFGRLLEALRPIMFQIPYFTLVNIVAGREVIKELLAHYFTVESVREELRRILTDEACRRHILDGYRDVRAILDHSPTAQTAAEIITSSCE